MGWKFTVLGVLTLYGAATLLFSHGLQQGRRGACGHGIPNRDTGGCICDTRYAGPGCQRCAFGRWGPSCWLGSDAPAGTASTPPPHAHPVNIAVITAPSSVSTTLRRVSQLRPHLAALPEVGSVHILQWAGQHTAEFLTTPAHDIGFIVITEYADDMPAALRALRTTPPGRAGPRLPAVVVGWALRNTTDPFLWQALGLDAYLSPSDAFLRRIGSAPRGAVLHGVGEPLFSGRGDCAVAGGAAAEGHAGKNITFFGDFTEQNQEALDELQGFGGVRVVGGGWAGRPAAGQRAGQAVASGGAAVAGWLRGSRVCVVADGVARGFSDAPDALAFDAAACGCAFLPLPRSGSQMPLRHVVPKAEYPQDLLDMRVLVSQLLSPAQPPCGRGGGDGGDGGACDVAATLAAKYRSAAESHPYLTPPRIAKELLNVYSVLRAG